MNDRKQPQPWHPADANPPARRGAPLGTHSLTGGGTSVGMPTPEPGQPERSTPREQPRAAEADLLTEPRAGAPDLLGRK